MDCPLFVYMKRKRINNNKERDGDGKRNKIEEPEITSVSILCMRLVLL